MAELGKRSEPGLPAEEPNFDPEAVRRFVDLSAENELYYQITGSPRVYDVSDPSVAANVRATVQGALAAGEFTDSIGARCKIPPWDDRTKLNYATAFLKRTIPRSTPNS